MPLVSFHPLDGCMDIVVYELRVLGTGWLDRQSYKGSVGLRLFAS